MIGIPCWKASGAIPLLLSCLIFLYSFWLAILCLWYSWSIVCTRNASYATQPLELLNDLGFENSKHHTVLVRNLEIITADNESPTFANIESLDNISITLLKMEMVVAIHQTCWTTIMERTALLIWMKQEVATEKIIHFYCFLMELYCKLKRNVFIGMPSPSGRLEKPTVPEGLERSQTIGQKIMGNMMDNRFIRSFTSKPKIQASDNLPTSPSKVLRHFGLICCPHCCM